MTSTLIAILVAVTAHAETASTAGCVPATDSTRVAVAVAALSFARGDSSFIPRDMPADSILVDIGTAYSVSGEDTTVPVDSLAALLSMRVALRPYRACSSVVDTDGRYQRATCAFRDTKYYLELAEVDVMSDSAFATVVVLHRVQEPRRRRESLLTKVKRLFGRAVGLERRAGLAVNIQARMVRLRRDGDQWKALKVASR